MYGDVRYDWKHGILPEHIESRRIALTMREPGKDFQNGGPLFERYGEDLIERGNKRLATRAQPVT